MNNIWTLILLVIICTLASYYLSQIWVPFGYLGLIVALALIGTYLFKRNKRIR